MRFIEDTKPKGLLHNWVFWLILISGLAIIIRSIPGWLHAAWGCDFGIYYGITKSVAQSGILFPTYSGWGSSYNEFPVLFTINAFAHRITGIAIIDLMPKLTPIFGGLSVLIFYFVARKLIDNKKIALLCTIFFAFMPFHVYQTSHASPLTMGHFFMMLSLYLFLKYRENTKYIIPLLISTMLLIMSHHLTTYFYLISLIGIVFAENASRKEWTLTLKKDFLYVIIVSALTFIYWASVAKTVYESFIRTGFSIGGVRLESIYVIIIFYVLLAFLFGIGVRITRRLNDYIVKFKTTVKSPILKFFIWTIYSINPFAKKRWPSARSRLLIFFVVLIAILGSMFYFTTTKMPWVGFSFTNLSIVYALPLTVAIAFGIAGTRYTWYMKNGLFIRGWIIAIAISFIFMLATNNRTILPHRHLEYIMAPLAILTVLGIGGIFSDPFYKGLFSNLKNRKDIYVRYISNKITIIYKNRLISFLVIVILVTSLAGTTYEVHKLLDRSWEEITTEDIASFDWMNSTLNKNTSVIASDHRLERMIESYGFNTTKDEMIVLWSAEHISEYVDELIGVGKNYSRITHILVDDIMKNRGVHIGPKEGVFRTIYMTNDTWNASYEKFKKQPFELVYVNQSVNINEETLEPIHWAEVYRINWTYIEAVI